MSHRTIAVVDYVPKWPELFEAERELLSRTLGKVSSRIDHIGSTVVPGLAAKPIIDILLEVTDLEALDAINEDMRALGYQPRGEYGIPDRRYFEKGGDNHTHHVHAFCRSDPNVIRHIALRDYPRANSEVARDYGELKRAVAATYGNDLERYCDGKDAHVKRLEAAAIQALEPDDSL